MDFLSLLPPYTSPVNPSSALFQGEILLSKAGGWPAVGLYEGVSKLPPPFDVMTVHLTTHRILLIPTPTGSTAASSSHHPHKTSHAIALSEVRQTEFYAGFLTSSAKVTLGLSPTPSDSISASTKSTNSSNNSTATSTPVFGDRWTCNLCAFSNPPAPPGQSPLLIKCQMCGVLRSLSSDSVAATPPRVNSPAPAPLHETISSGSRRNSMDDLDPLVIKKDYIECPSCTFHNSLLLSTCEICSTTLPSPKSQQLSSTITSSSLTSKAAPPKAATVKLSFRKGGDKEFYAALKNALSRKEWNSGMTTAEVLLLNRKKIVGSGGDGVDSGVGINAVLNSISQSSDSRTTQMETSLKDLDSLMKKGKEMVTLALSLSEKIAQQKLASTSADDRSNLEESENVVFSSLVQLGLPSPAVTADMASSDAAYLQSLAKELGSLLDKIMSPLSSSSLSSSTASPQSGKKGIIGLDEVYCIWNRARGVALVPPKALRLVAPLLAQHTSPPISFREFEPSGLCILHTPEFSHQSFTSRLFTLLSGLSNNIGKESVDVPIEGIGTIDLAVKEGVSVALVREMLRAVERENGVVRDEQDKGGGGGGEKWFSNEILRCQWVELNPSNR